MNEIKTRLVSARIEEIRARIAELDKVLANHPDGYPHQAIVAGDMNCEQGDLLKRALRLRPLERFGMYQGENLEIVCVPPDGKAPELLPPCPLYPLPSSGGRT